MQPKDGRTRIAQHLCRASLEACGLEVVKVYGEKRPLFADLLCAARAQADEWFAWVNADCQLLMSPECYDCSDLDVIGMRRVEVGTGELCCGVDGYYIRSSFWDEVLSQDIPKLWAGGTHVDWWVTRASQKYGRYAEMMLLAHPPHDKSETSLGLDEQGKENIENFEAWADRHGVSSGRDQH